MDKCEPIDSAKGYLLDIQNPYRMNFKMAEFYNNIGFLSDNEFQNYKLNFAASH